LAFLDSKIHAVYKINKQIFWHQTMLWCRHQWYSGFSSTQS